MKAFSEPSNNGLSVDVGDLFQYQTLARQLHFPLQNPPTNTLQGDKQTRIKGRGMAFTHLRQYERGDDVRLIDWRVTARLGKPHTRQYNEDKSQPFYLVVDVGDSMYFGSKRQLKSVLAAKVAATLLWQIQINREPLSLLLCNSAQTDYLAPSTSERQLTQCFARLSKFAEPLSGTYSMNTPQRVINAMQLLLKNLQPGSITIVISDFIDWPEQAIEYCHQLDARGQLLLYHINDPIDSEQKRTAKENISLLFTDGKTTQQRLLDVEQTVTNSFLDQLSVNQYHKTSVSTHQSLRQQLLAGQLH